MSKEFEQIDEKLAAWIAAQPIFFVATAPRSDEGFVNCSPKGGLGTLAVLDPLTVAYLDLTGSGAETAAHLRENGRIVIMWCAFAGPPRIVRVHGHGRVVLPGDAEFDGTIGRFTAHPGVRAIIVVTAKRLSDSCGYAVPLMAHEADRRILDDWAAKKGPDGLAGYRAEKNSQSLDGLPAF
jgi:hypothetical protein